MQRYEKMFLTKRSLYIKKIPFNNPLPMLKKQWPKSKTITSKVTATAVFKKAATYTTALGRITMVC